MKTRLTPALIDQIRTSLDSVAQTAARLGISMASVSKYRPVHRKHLSALEQDQIILEQDAGISAIDTAVRLGISRATVFAHRKRARAALGAIL